MPNLIRRFDEPGHPRLQNLTDTVDDVLQFAGHNVKNLDRTVRVLKVTGFSERRGDASAARVLYEDLQQKP